MTTTPSATKRPGSTSTTGRGPEFPPPAGRPRVTDLLAAAQQYLADAQHVLGTIPAAPGLTLTPVEVAELEALLGVSVPLTPLGLRTAVERLASLRIGDIRIPFTPGQLAELQHRAGKRGRTVEMEMRAVVARIEEELFYKGS